MDVQIFGLRKLLCFSVVLVFGLVGGASALRERENPSRNQSGAQINSNSVLVALLDSHYTELSELVEKALLLQTLEEAVSRHNITIFAPRNEALERDLDPEFKRFLLEPGNLRSLQNLLLFHMIPTRIESKNWPVESRRDGRNHLTLCRDAGGENLIVSGKEVSGAKVVSLNDVVRPDGIIHGIERVLIPNSVQQAFNARRSLRSISAVLPTGAPEVDPRTHRLKKPAGPTPAGSPPSQVKDFIQTLLHYGGYNELADILVNLTSLASEMGRLVSEGYVLTVLAPNDEAMAKLTTDQLSEPGAPEQIIYYHLIPEYQTEESMYNAARRFGKIRYDTLRLPHKVVAEEADGSVKFGHGEGSAYLFDPDIYTDGRISVQGIDGVLFPPEPTKPAAPKASPLAKVASKPRRAFSSHGEFWQLASKLSVKLSHMDE
nr:fasciclin-like arabinogalactan protein 15 [Ipomoea batatas]GME03009.1 fasciclin-like arabinogalactan protein 15 [Ipomoea batatas]